MYYLWVTYFFEIKNNIIYYINNIINAWKYFYILKIVFFYNIRIKLCLAHTCIKKKKIDYKFINQNLNTFTSNQLYKNFKNVIISYTWL